MFPARTGAPGADSTWDVSTDGAGDAVIVAGSKTTRAANRLQALAKHVRGRSSRELVVAFS